MDYVSIVIAELKERLAEAVEQMESNDGFLKQYGTGKVAAYQYAIGFMEVNRHAEIVSRFEFASPGLN